MGTDSLFDFLEDDSLLIPAVKSSRYPAGKDYHIPSPDGETGARLAALAELATKVAQGVEISDRDRARLEMNDDDEREFIIQVLGSAYAEMQGDGVSWVRIQRIGQFAYLHFAFSPDAAREAAEKGILSGKGPALNRASRRAAARADKAPRAPQGSTATKPRQSPKRANG